MKASSQLYERSDPALHFDFSPKGGPADLVGKWSKTGLVIAWPDGTPPRIPLTPGQPETIAVNLGVPWPWFWLSFAMCTAIFIFGYRFFNARKWRFVEAA